MSAGAYHTIVLTTEGLFACGRNDFGQLGIEHVQHCSNFVPVKLTGAIKQNFSISYKINQWKKLAGLTVDAEKYIGKK